MSVSWCAAVPGGVHLSVQVTPNAKKTEPVGVLDGALRLKLQAQPVEGKANEALVRYVAGALKVPKSAVDITHGHTSRKKLVLVSCPGLTPEQVAAALYPDAQKS